MIRVFPRKTNMTPTDELAFVGDPPMPEFLPSEQPVRVSVTFTWDKEEGYRLVDAWSQYYSDVQIGGPAFDSPCDGFVPGLFVKEGVTFTSRGCCWSCEYCHVQKREGKVRPLGKIAVGHIVQDNNLLATPKQHLLAVFEMLRDNKKAAIFSGGLDTRLVKTWHRELFDSISVKELWFACDSDADLDRLPRVAEIFEGYSQNKMRCYTMIGFNESIEQAEARLRQVFDLGFLPYAQLYQGEVEREWPSQWKKLQRTFSRPAGTKAYMRPSEPLPLFKAV